MLRIFIINTVFVLISLTSKAQISIPQAYTDNIKLADSLSEAGNYHASAEAYTIAFKSFGSRGFDSDRYKAARVYGLSGMPDSAITSLRRLIFLRFYNHDKPESDPAFNMAKRSPEWKAIIDSFKVNKSKFAPLVNLKFQNHLDSILQDDQAIRVNFDALSLKGGPEFVDARKRMRYIDSINLQQVTNFIDQNGWLGEEIIGMPGTETLFLVIQHSDTKTQEKYLPLLKAAVLAKKAPPHQLAMLEDRLSVAHSGYQIYGSQLYQDPNDGKFKVSPIQDEQNVDKRRKAVGLEPLADYLKRYDIDYKK